MGQTLQHLTAGINRSSGFLLDSSRDLSTRVSVDEQSFEIRGSGMHTCAEIPRTARADLVVRLHNWGAIKKGGIMRRVKKRSYGSQREVRRACEGAAECSVVV